MPKGSFIESAAVYTRKLTAKSQSNFYYAFLFLPKERREALEAVYAYCRLVDDVVDEDAPVEKKLAGIERWRRELDHVYGNTLPENPVSARLQEAIKHFAIRREDMEAVIDGCAMDIEKTRYTSWDELRLYCYRVASAVGLMCIEIFGYPRDKQEQVREYAINLGLALQLTNILRDVREDARRGRVYLPQDELAAFGVDERELLGEPNHLGEVTRSPQLVRMLRYNAQRARAHYLRARAAINQSDRRQLVIAEIMGDIYYALLCRLEESGFDVFGEKLKVRRRRKMAIALRNFASAKLHQLAG